MSDADAVFIERVFAGQRQAFEGLVARHLHWARCVAAGEIHPDRVEAVVRAAFHQAWRRLGDCRDPSHFPAWLLGLLRQECVARRRRDPEAAQVLPARDQAWMDDEDLRRLALAGLSRDERELLLLVQDAELGYDQVQEILDLGRERLEERLLAARRALRAAIERCAAG